MAKKAVNNATKPLPSALMVASSAKSSPAVPPQRLKESAAAEKVPQASTPATTPNLPPTPAAACPKPSPQPPSPESPEQSDSYQANGNKYEQHN